MQELLINGRNVGVGHAPFVIAEVGINHNGEVEKAIEMIGVAKTAGADAVKFQTFQAAEFVGGADQMFTYRSRGKEVTESMLAMFKRYELPREAWSLISKECRRQGITFISTPQNRTDLDLLCAVGISAVKVGSDDFTNLPLLRSYAETGLPLILSCGMADLAEVHQALDAVGALDGYPTVLLLCTSQYPTPPHDINLRKLRTLQASFPWLVTGFSDHSEGSLASSLAVAMGALVLEKHFTLNNDLPGPDHWFSENPDTLARWVTGIRTAAVMLGSNIVRPTVPELEMRKIARRSLVALTNIFEGETLDLNNVGARRPGHGLAPSFLDQAIGAIATCDIRAGKVLALGDFRK